MKKTAQTRGGVARKAVRARTRSGVAPARTDAGSVVEGRAVALAREGHASVVLEDGRKVIARLPQHVDAQWLGEAVKQAPVEAAVALLPGGRALLWSLFPGPEHAGVVVDVELVGRTVTVRGEAGVEVQCNGARLQLDAEGDVTLRGRDVMTRASKLNRIQGGSIRLN